MKTLIRAVQFWALLTVLTISVSLVVYLFMQLASKLYSVVDNYVIYTAIMAAIFSLAATVAITVYYMINRETSVKIK
jgi:uncharacterized BrkB/YihY/UPF0761 family membrane protein